MNCNKKYSILMTAHKNDVPEYFSESIDSILNQTVKSDDIVIIVDGPISKKLNDLIRQYEIMFPKIISVIKFKKNHTRGVALAEGVIRAKNKYVGIQDSDDISQKNRFGVLLHFMNTHPHIDILGSNITHIYENSEEAVIKYPENNTDIYRLYLRKTPICQSASMFNRDSILEIGNYKKRYRQEDFELYCRAIYHKKQLHNIQKPLVKVRVQDDYYRRRSNKEALRSCLNLYKELRSRKQITIQDYLFVSIRRVLFTYLPHPLKKIIYKVFIRK